MTIGFAGVPYDLALTRDYDAIFSLLRDAGVDVFSPVSIYQEYPQVESVGLEYDFLPSPYGTATPELYQLARDYGIKIAFSADVLYPLPEGIDSDADPLQAIIDAGGRDIIHSIVSYDEPVLNSREVADSQAVYEHVKAIDPTLSVVQIHASIPEGADPETYLEEVEAHAVWADDIGFSVYPISAGRGAVTPYSDGESVDPVAAVADYAAWLKATFPDKDHTLVLQAYGAADLYSPEAQAQMSPEVLALSRQPDFYELRAMAIAAGDVESIYWWGSSLSDSSSETWTALVQVATMLSGPGLGTPLAPLVDLDASIDALAEDVMAGAYAGVTLNATDPDAIDTVTFDIDDARFEIDESNRLIVAAGARFDYETEASIDLSIEAVSSDGSHETIEVTIAITDVVDQLLGTEAADSLGGGSGADFIDLAGGADLALGNEGADTIRGGDGDDQISGGTQFDVLWGGAGNDVIRGDFGDDFISGDEGNDTLYGDFGNDEIDGGSGDDQISGDGGNDTIRGGDGADSIDAGALDDSVEGGAGNDFILLESGDDEADGGGGADVIFGGVGHDTIHGGDDADQLYGDENNDWLYGDDGDDYISGDAGYDFARGGAGDDIILGGLGNDRLLGEAGNDRLEGGDGVDRMYGQGGADFMQGGDHVDQLFGGAGTDILYGDGGNDQIVGGAGNDTLFGGEGADQFMTSTGHGNDIVMDFELGVDRLTFFRGVTFEELRISDFNTHTLIAFGEDSVLLADVQQESWSESDFSFI